MNRERLLEYSRQRYAAHPERSWSARNREKANAIQRRRRAADPEKAKAYKRAWYAAHRENCLTHTKRWREANRETVRECDRRRRKARMLKSLPEDPFVQEVMAAMFDLRSEAQRESHAHLRK